MSWAMRRRILYALGVMGFFAVLFGGPLAYKYFTIPPTCSDGIQNQGETGIDTGGPCPALNPTTLQPSTVLWTRSFKVHDGSYSVVAYVENPNANAGVGSARYVFRLYDADNILVAEREGSTFIMPGGITPVFEGGIDTGHRIVAHAFFAFRDTPLAWEHMRNMAQGIEVSNISPSDTGTAPRIAAIVRNTTVTPVFDVSAVAVVFDTAGNAIAASATRIPRIGAGDTQNIVFTWPDPFVSTIGRIDIIPLVAPAVAVQSAP